MKISLILLLTTLSWSIAWTQGIEKKLGYFDEYYRTTSDSTTAAYSITLELSEKCYCYIVREYYLSGKIRSRVEYSQYDDREKSKDGKATQYYENGNVQEKGIYKDNNPVGEFVYYYEKWKASRTQRT